RFREPPADARRLGDLVERAGEPAPGRVAHAPDAGRARVEYRSDEPGQWGGVALQHGLELDPLANGHDGDAVVADRAGDQDAVARPGVADGQPPALGDDADAGGRDVDLVAFAAVDDFGVAGHERYAGVVAGLAH